MEIIKTILQKIIVITILLTINFSAQAQWELKRFALNSLTSCHFIDANTGWAAGASGEIKKTTNGGTTWTAQTSNTAQGLLDIHFVDANTGWAVGSTGAIVTTSNGGTTWTAQTSNTNQTLNGVYFRDNQTGWAVGNSENIVLYLNGVVLPVEMTYFKGENIDNQNHLTWQTASEQNNHGFYIEKSTNGTNWEEIGFVQGNGTTTEVSNYEFTDDLNHVSFENRHGLYYRLKQIDYDGNTDSYRYEYSEIITINSQLLELQYNSTIEIYPNPTIGDIVNINIGTSENAYIALHNNTGQLIRSYRPTNDILQINMADLPNGIYYATIIINGIHTVEKLIKQ